MDHHLSERFEAVERLCREIATGNLPGVQELLNAGTALDNPVDQWDTPEDPSHAPLHYAAHWGHVQIIDELLKNGANINAAGDCDVTPIIEAASSGNLETLKRLMSAGANLSLRDISGQGPLHHAVYEAPLEVVEYLLDLGCDPLEKDVDGNTPLENARRRPEVVELILRKHDLGQIVVQPTKSEVALSDEKPDPSKVHYRIVPFTVQ